jgi:tetratricopeptide (TPR) repeat protein
MRETKIGLGPEDRTQRDLREAATGETQVADSRSSAPAVGRGSGVEGGPQRGDAIGRFVVLGVLGTGGMGVVYSAYDPHLDRKVAIKVLTAEAASASGADAHTRLLREAQAMAKIRHPNVIVVHEVGMLGEHVFVAMEFADGGTLRDWLTTRKRDQREILDVFTQAGRGLAAAHAAGLVHRDFKPDNVLLSSDGTARVTDFGLVGVMSERAEDDTVREPRVPEGLGELSKSGSTPLTEDLTRTGAIMGTPRYMAPEQFRGTTATARTDQFAFCVALYEAVYGERPFAGVTYAELCTNVLIGTMQPVPKGAHVPGWLRKVLVRGLSLDPAARFASMNELLAALHRDPRKRRLTAILAVSALVVVGAGAAAALWLRPDADGGASPCEIEARKRIDAAWSVSAAQQLQTRFAHSGRPYAELAAKNARAALDRYGTRWRELATDVCAAEKANSGPAPELLVRRHACLDSRLDELRTVVALLTGEDNAAFVDHAGAITGGLGDLGPCTDASALMAAPGVPAAAIAPQVAELQRQLEVARARGAAGEFKASGDKAKEILAKAKPLAWAPLDQHAHAVLGEMDLYLLDPDARNELMTAAALATANHLDRDAADALRLAQIAAATSRVPEAVATLSPIARAAAERTGDKTLVVLADIDRARSIVRLHEWEAGGAACRSGLAAAQQIDSKRALEEAYNCMVEALTPLGAHAELDPLLDKLIEEKSKELGAEHPVVADYLVQRAHGEVLQGKLEQAHKDAQRVVDIYAKLYPPKHFKVAQGYDELADVLFAEGKSDEAMALQEKALAATDESRPEQMITIVQLLISLAMEENDKPGKAHHDAAIARFQHAKDLVEKQSGTDSLELAVLLINYGQVRSEDSVEESLALLRQSKEIFQHHKDPRISAPATAMAIVAINAKRYADALKYAEESLAALDANAPPSQVAHVKELIAMSLWETHGDHQRARKLATESRDIWAKLGPQAAPQVKKLDTWLAAHK